MVWVIFRISLCKRVGVCINFTSFSLSGCKGLISSCGQKSITKCLSPQPFQMGILPLPLLSLTRRICSLTCIIFGRTTGLLAAVLGRDILSVPYCQKKKDALRGKRLIEQNLQHGWLHQQFRCLGSNALFPYRNCKFLLLLFQYTATVVPLILWLPQGHYIHRP